MFFIFVETFGTLSWNDQEDKVVYIAEKTLPKTAPFYEQKAKTNSCDKNKDSRIVQIFLFLDIFSYKQLLQRLKSSFKL